MVLFGDAAYCPMVNTAMGTTCVTVGAYVLAGEIAINCIWGEDVAISHKRECLMTAFEVRAKIQTIHGSGAERCWRRR